MSNSKTVAIIQARMGSSRLPGKMMMELGGQPILLWVLRRVKNSKLVDSIVLATSKNKIDDPLGGLAKQLAITVFRGSEGDVLGRFLDAAKEAEAGKIIRICADNPLVAPEEIDRLIDVYSTVLKKGVNSEKLYAFNFASRMNNGYPDGLGGEMFSLKLLQKLDQLATSPLQREHVNNYIWDYPKNFTIHPVKAPKNLVYPNIKLDVDTIDDLRILNILCGQLNFESSAVEIVETYNRLFNFKG